MFFFLSLGLSAYYNTYDTLATIKTKHGCTAMQGIAVGSKYIYTVKVKVSDNSKQILHKTHQETKKVTLLKESETGKTYCTYLGHANDMDVMTLDGESHLFVSTMKSGSQAVVLLKVVGDKFTKVGQFKVEKGGKSTSVSGIAIWKKTSKEITLLFKKGTDFYKGTIGINQRSGTITIKKAFSINIKSAKIDGTSMDLSSFTHQGFGLEGNTLYVPLWNKKKPNVSIIPCYNISNPSGTLKTMSDLSFRITSSSWSKFEIESCGVSDGKLYFNTNRNKDKDGVHVFKKYVMSK